MSKQAIEAPKELTYEEIVGPEQVAFEKRLDEFLDRTKRDIEEMRAMMLEMLNNASSTPKEEPVVEQLKKEIVELKKENADLKQQLSDLWDRFKAAVSEKTASAGKAFSSLFSTNKKVVEPKVANEEHSNAPSL